jgi:hypothetical protein
MGMNQESRIHVWDIPKQTALSKVGKDGFTTLFGGGIINPLGPTLDVVVLDGVIAQDKELPILQIMLNPFAQEVKVVGVVSFQETWNPSQDLSPLICPTLGGCPTLLLPSRVLEPDEVIELYASFLSHFDDGFTVLEKVRRFPGDPWKRVSDDVNDAFGGLGEKLKKPQVVLETKSQARRLSNLEARELSTCLLAPKTSEEIKAFIYAWKGSIQFQTGYSNSLRYQHCQLTNLFRYLQISPLAVTCQTCKSE